MKPLEYRLEEVRFRKGGSRAEQILNILSQLGKDGWRIRSIGGESRVVLNEAGFKVLMQRELEEPAHGPQRRT